MPAIALVGGLLVGSFLNVVAHRLPRGESLVSPGSRCPSCETPIKPWHNVPVLSWLLLRGRCASCGERISARYPLVEAVTALLWAAVVAVHGFDLDAVPGLVLVSALVPITLIDLDERRIPNAITYPLAVLALPLVALAEPDRLVEHAVAGAAAGGFLLVAALAYPKGMGMGDVKLALVLGLFLGRGAGVALLVALVAGVVVGAAIMARRGVAEGRKTAVPFGPFLALGGVVGLLAGDGLVEAYLDAFA